MSIVSNGQNRIESLPFYIDAAKRNSPFIKDYNDRREMEKSELVRLRAVYTHSRLELTGDYLFVPIVSNDKGRASFRWNAQDATDYYGYDLGESSGHLHAGLTWTKPLLGLGAYNAAKNSSNIKNAIYDNSIRMEQHMLERTVAEHYLLCLLDIKQIKMSDSMGEILQRQRQVVELLSRHGFAKQSDVRLIDIEADANDEQRIAAIQSYRSHLTELNLVCGIRDTAVVALQDVEITTNRAIQVQSSFAEQYRLDSLSALADLRMYDLQYRPNLNVFVDGGLRISDFTKAYRHFGWSAGLTFSLTLFDGHQRKYKLSQIQSRLSTIANYRNDAERQRSLRMKQCVSELRQYSEREGVISKQLEEYRAVLDNYEKEIKAGQMSVLDYITVLKHMMLKQYELLTLRTNKQLVAVAYNYWNY